ncbi:prolactin receptor-like [Narcine bancroftii]|uniref:prolactin receptor-like n=1 Tax=Narcine bancroftii TaxID=1343680 RepID=UPI0038310B2F
MDAHVSTTFMLLYLLAHMLELAALSPAKPRISHCRSTDKETFTCWWEPAQDGESTANHTLWYSLEGEEQEHECADYVTMGPSSCFFDQSHTSIRTIYNISVVAFSPLGRTISNPVYIDVLYIVQPPPPVNVNLQARTDQEGDMVVTWSPPTNRTTHLEWTAMCYQVRLKPRKASWEYFNTGLEVQFTFHNLNHITVYLVQVRCRTHQGFWSEWSLTTCAQTPEAPGMKIQRVWILLSSLFCVTCLVLLAIIGLKVDIVRRFVWPPIPEPTIGGLNLKALKRAGPGIIGVPHVMWPPEPEDLWAAVEIGGHGQDPEWVELQEGGSMTHSPSDWSRALVAPSNLLQVFSLPSDDKYTDLVDQSWSVGGARK